MGEKILVTDANYKHTLGIIRSLGSKSLHVSCGSKYLEHTPISSYSKYVESTFFYPDPKKEPYQFSHYLKKITENNKINIIIPVGYEAYSAISSNRELFKNYNIPLPDVESFKIAASKIATVTLANKLNIPAPLSIKISSMTDLKDINLNFPIVVKGLFSSGYVRYAKNSRELENYVNEIKHLQGEYPIIQEYIVGAGYGFFGLFKNGLPRAYFMHKRIREYPITGGPSTCAQSVYDEKLLEFGFSIMKELKWNGVAMVEFKKDKADNKFKIMEINPKFWGSLDLAIASGIDFPYLLYKMIVDGDVKSIYKYQVGLKYMWPFPDDFKRVIKDVRNTKSFFSDLINPVIEKNIKMSDLRPNLIQFNSTIRDIIKNRGES